MPPQQPQPPIQPLPGQPGYPSQPKKKPNKIGAYVALGAAGLVLVGGLIWWATLGEEPKPAPTQEEPTVTADVKLTEAQKKKVYTSLMIRKEMLRPMGAVDNAYKTLAGENKISVQGVHSIEAEGNSKRWPKE